MRDPCTGVRTSGMRECRDHPYPAFDSVILRGLSTKKDAQVKKEPKNLLRFEFRDHRQGISTHARGEVLKIGSNCSDSAPKQRSDRIWSDDHREVHRDSWRQEVQQIQRHDRCNRFLNRVRLVITKPIL